MLRRPLGVARPYLGRAGASWLHLNLSKRINDVFQGLRLQAIASVERWLQSILEGDCPLICNSAMPARPADHAAVFHHIGARICITVLQASRTATLHYKFFGRRKGRCRMLSARLLMKSQRNQGSIARCTLRGEAMIDLVSFDGSDLPPIPSTQ